MTNAKMFISKFGNSRRDNIIFTLDAGESAPCHFKENGNDTATDKYWNLGSEAKRVNILPDIVATMTHINNQELKSPRTLTVGGTSFREGIEWKTITVRADQDSTTFEIYAS